MSFTAAQLTSAIKDMVDVDEPAFNANIPLFIRNAEERIFKTVQLNLFRKNNLGVTTIGNKYLATPTDYMAAFALSIRVNGDAEFLSQKDVSFAQSFWPDGAETGRPRYYAQYDNTALLLVPTPDAAYPVEIHYFYRPLSLNDVTPGTTTWLSVNAADALLYGSLSDAAIFLKAEDASLQRYEQRFIEAVARLKNLGEAMQTTDQYRYGLVRTRRT
jgi:hypothetical protein